MRIGATELEVHPLYLGGNPFGWTADETESFAVLDAYVAAGGNFIDTADVYSAWKPGNVGGESETIIGNWLASRGNRDDLIIATKVAKHPQRRGLGAANIRAAVEDSLRRLRTDRIDLYYAHEDDADTPMTETLSTFTELVQQGKVRYIAASQFTAPRLAEAVECSRREGFARYVGLQTQYNLMEREYEEGLQQVCVAQDIACFPFYGVARGFLTGKYRPGVAVDSVRAKQVLADYGNDTGWRMVEALNALAAKYGVSEGAIALEWLRRQPGVAAPLASARTPQQLTQLMQSVVLEDADVALLSAIRA